MRVNLTLRGSPCGALECTAPRAPASLAGGGRPPGLPLGPRQHVGLLCHGRGCWLLGRRLTAPRALLPGARWPLSAVLAVPGGARRPRGDSPAASAAVPQTDSPRPAALREEAPVRSRLWAAGTTGPPQAPPRLAERSRHWPALEGSPPPVPNPSCLTPAPPPLDVPAWGVSSWGGRPRCPRGRHWPGRGRGSLLPGARDFSGWWPGLSLHGSRLSSGSCSGSCLSSHVASSEARSSQVKPADAWSGADLLLSQLTLPLATSPGSPGLGSTPQRPPFASRSAPDGAHSLLLGL